MLLMSYPPSNGGPNTAGAASPVNRAEEKPQKCSRATCQCAGRTDV